MAYNAKKTSHIDNFNGTDFTSWKKQVLIVLKVHKLDKVADGTFLCPVQEIDDDGNPLLNEAGVPTQQETIQEWNDKDLQAQDLLFSTTDPGTISTRFIFHNLTEISFPQSLRDFIWHNLIEILIVQS